LQVGLPIGSAQTAPECLLDLNDPEARNGDRDRQQTLSRWLKC
jgi:hypothetical protein